MIVVLSSRLRVAFALATLGHVAFFVQQLAVGDSVRGLSTTLVATIGYGIAAFGLAAWGIRVAAVAGAIDLFVTLGNPFALSTMPSVVAPIGLIMAAWSTRSSGHEFGVRAGLAFAALGTSMWILIDPLHAVSAWLPGILLTVTGLGLAAGSYGEPAPVDGAVDVVA